MDALGEASCLVHANGQLVHASPVARELLGSHHGLVLRQGRLWHADGRIRQQLYAALLQAASTDRVQKFVFPDQPLGEKRRVTRAALVRANAQLRLGNEAQVFIRFHWPRPDRELAPTELVQALGITSAEARVLTALAAGATPSDYADCHGISIHTVRNQIASTMIKLGCTRQVDLVRIALGVL